MVRSPSRSRFRPFLILTLVLLTVIYLTTGPRSTQTSEFYTRTVAAMDARQRSLRSGLQHGGAAAEAQAALEAKVRDGQGEIVLPPVRDHDGGKGEQVSSDKPRGQEVVVEDDEVDDEETMVDQAKNRAKEVADKVVGKGKKKPAAADKDDDDADAVHGPASSEPKMKGKKVEKGKGGDDGVAKVGNTGGGVTEGKGKGGKDAVGDSEADVVLVGILKKSPIVIFSKTFCPYSMKAKRILLQGYKIVPAPYVEELDEHAMGDRLQNALHKLTGRRTVPNILINGKSIGGGDDIQDLDKADGLAKMILSLGGKRMTEVTKLQRKEDDSGS